MTALLARMYLLTRRLHCATGLAACCVAASVSASPAPPPTIAAPSWLVLDHESGQILAEHSADTPLQPASLTKLMTAYIVLQAIRSGALQWNETVQPRAEEIAEVKGDEAQMFLHAGKNVTVRELVRGLIAASANDAALVLARRVAGSVPAFEIKMNDAAQALGMRHSHFSTPSGITTPGNYSTARDLATLAARITREFPEYYRFSSQEHFAYGTFKKRNRNFLLGLDPTVDGMKTGHTEAAGWCIVATANRAQPGGGARRIFVVALNSPSENQRVRDARALLKYGYRAFEDVPTRTSGRLISRPIS